VIAFNTVLNRLEAHVLRWRPTASPGSGSEMQVMRDMVRRHDRNVYKGALTMVDRRIIGLSRRSFTLGTLAVAAPADRARAGLDQGQDHAAGGKPELHADLHRTRPQLLHGRPASTLQVVVTRGDGPDVQALMAKEVDFVATAAAPSSTRFILQNRKLLGVCGILGAAAPTW